MAKFLGIDVGTSSIKAVLVDEHGSLLRQASREYPLHIPRPMWSEQDPGDWWAGALDVIRELGEESPDAIGLTGQMHGSVFLDAAGEVVRRALLWNDQRTAAECAEMDATIGAERLRASSCKPSAAVRNVLLPKDYIRFKMTGESATDVSDASGTGLLDVPRRDWSGEMLAALGLDHLRWPRVCESFAQTGVTRGVPGLADGIPVVAGGGDQAASAVGTGAVVEGVVSVSLGTSGVVFVSLPEPKFHSQGAAHTFCHANGGWHAMGVMLSCGGALRWFRDTFGKPSYDAIAAEAATVPAGADGLTFLPYLTGERCPHNDPQARAAFLGLTLAHGSAHLSRAVFEGVSFGLADGMALLRGLGARVDEIRVTGGGARSGFWVRMLADVFGAPCRTLEMDEGPALGAAILAGGGVGVWPDVAQACRSVVRTKSEVSPSGTDYAVSYAAFRAAYRPTANEG